MSNQSAKTADNPPKATIRKKSWNVPVVWMVPLMAALVAGYLIYQRMVEYDSTITIQFRDVSGVSPGQTQVRYRGVNIGRVAAVRLSDDHQSATLEVRLRRHSSSVARTGASFWIVRPQLGMGDFTGLDTIVTGPYLEVLPGSGDPAFEFVGREHSPALVDPDGLKVVLLSAQSASLSAGAPIYYRGVAVGAVRETRLGTNASAVEIHGVIRRRYAPLVRASSKFWNVTGLDVRIGLFSGAELDVTSLKSLFIGGVAFATPEDSTAGPAVGPMVFQLNDKPDDDWLEWAPPIAIPLADGQPEQVELKSLPNLP